MSPAGERAPGGTRTGLRRVLSRRGRPLLMAMQLIPRLEITEIVAGAGYDAIAIDLEHAPFAREELPALLAAARGGGLAAVVRVPGLDPAAIGGALDAGADGVIVPGVVSSADARRAVAATRFPPEGTRGVNGYVRAGAYGGDARYLARANGAAACFVMIEGPDALAAVDEIVATPGLDGVLIGPFDLSAGLGVLGEVHHPSVRAAARRVAAAARAAGVAAAIFATSPADAESWIAEGVRVIALGVDTNVLLQAFTALVQGVPGAAPAPSPG